MVFDLIQPGFELESVLQQQTVQTIHTTTDQLMKFDLPPRLQSLLAPLLFHYFVSTQPQPHMLQLFE